MDFAINAGKYCSFNMRGTHAEVSFLWVYIFGKHCNVLGELLTLQSFGGHLQLKLDSFLLSLTCILAVNST